MCVPGILPDHRRQPYWMLVSSCCLFFAGGRLDHGYRCGVPSTEHLVGEKFSTPKRNLYKNSSFYCQLSFATASTLYSPYPLSFAKRQPTLNRRETASPSSSKIRFSSQSYRSPHIAATMCKNAVFYYTLCSHEEGYTAYDGGDPYHQDWHETLRNDPTCSAVHDCISGKRYPLQRIELQAPEEHQCHLLECADNHPSTRPCFDRFRLKLQLINSLLHSDEFNADPIDEKSAEISCRSSTHRMTALVKAKRVLSLPHTDKDGGREDDKQKTQDGDECGSKESHGYHIKPFQAPRTEEERKRGIEQVREYIARLKQSETARERKDSVLFTSDPPLATPYEQGAALQQPVTPLVTTRPQFPAPLLSDPLRRPTVRIRGMTKAALPPRFVPPKSYSYTSLAYTLGHIEALPLVANEIKMPKMAKNHTVSSGTRMEHANFEPGQLPVKQRSSTPGNQESAGRSKSHTISSLRPEAVPFVPRQQDTCSRDATSSFTRFVASASGSAQQQRPDGTTTRRRRSRRKQTMACG
ncbi:hypothetical protein BDW02DRAFT_575537 [Decorospora gaudefroyi]|uniref:Uncharacterized protein n=1 Tax=Decorospora gaudefroyi TaxID=184978 RepID=A0A6A5KXG8_9PLEO|nr:hypothetical protein BDW02DRAFT_575537 [Decorospora gaudefroyi]